MSLFFLTKQHGIRCALMRWLHCRLYGHTFSKIAPYYLSRRLGPFYLGRVKFACTCCRKTQLRRITLSNISKERCVVLIEGEDQLKVEERAKLGI